MKMFASLFAVALAAFAQCAAAQSDFPSRPIKIIVPYQAGSAPDSQARFVGQKLGELLKQAVVIENRPGAGGLIGGDAVAKAAPDGYTLGYISNQHLAHKYLMRTLPYDLERDLQPIQMIGILPQVLVVAASNPARTVSEFAAQAKAKGQPLTYGSGGIGAPAHLAGQAVAAAAGFKATHVPYKGSPESLTALIGGQIDYIVTTAPTAIPLVKSGKIHALAITSASRSELIPSVPTLTQALPNGFVFESWGVLMTSAQTPKPMVDKLAAALLTVMKEPATVQFFAASGARAETLPPAQLSEFVKTEDSKLAGWIRDAGLKPD